VNRIIPHNPSLEKQGFLCKQEAKLSLGQPTVL